jgi:hypothetical protein
MRLITTEWMQEHATFHENACRVMYAAGLL